MVPNSVRMVKRSTSFLNSLAPKLAGRVFGDPVGMILGGGEGILHEGEAIRSGLEGVLALLGREVDQKGEFLEHGIEGILDGLRIGGRERYVDVLIGHGLFFWNCCRDCCQ